MNSQTTRNFCEHCNLLHPDVERFQQHMPTTFGEWICLPFVDKLMIDDKFRVTQQSDVSKKGMFRRYFGKTIFGTNLMALTLPLKTHGEMK